VSIDIIVSCCRNVALSEKIIIKNYCKKNQILHLVFNSQNSRHRSHEIAFSSCIRWIFYGWNLFCFNILHTDFWSIEYSSTVLRMKICGFSIKDCKTFNDFSRFVAVFGQFLTLSVSSKRLMILWTEISRYLYFHSKTLH